MSNLNPIPMNLLNDLDFSVIESTEGKRLLVKINLSKSNCFFEGHFPDFPLLPGLLQIHFAFKIYQNVFDSHIKFNGFKNIKFINPIYPNSKINLEMIYQPELGYLDLHYFNERVSFCKGRAIVDIINSEVIER